MTHQVRRCRLGRQPANNQRGTEQAAGEQAVNLCEEINASLVNGNTTLWHNTLLMIHDRVRHQDAFQRRGPGRAGNEEEGVWMGQREEIAAALARAQQVNLLLSERGLSLEPPLSLLSCWMLVSNRESCGSPALTSAVTTPHWQEWQLYTVIL